MVIFAFVKSLWTHYVLRWKADEGLRYSVFPKRFGLHKLFNSNGIRGVP